MKSRRCRRWLDLSSHASWLAEATAWDRAVRVVVVEELDVQD